jgi:ethanolamine ammonia-lyase small subunit
MGKRLQPELIILLIGERPGLGPAASLSASMTSRPQAGDTDADHGRVSHLCANGDTDPRAGAVCILALAQQMRRYQISGAQLKVVVSSGDVSRWREVAQ